MEYIKGLIEKKGIDNMDTYDWMAVCEHCMIKEHSSGTTEDEYDKYKRIEFLAFQIFSELDAPMGDDLPAIKKKLMEVLL